MYILVLCPDLAIVNGQVNATTPPVALGYYSIGTSVSFACVNSAFKMDGSNFSTCDIVEIVERYCLRLVDCKKLILGALFSCRFLSPSFYT